MTGRLLVVTAVEAEADAVRAGVAPTARIHVEAVGVGPAAAAAGTARLLALAEAAGTPYRSVISAGIAGGIPGRTPVGATVLGVRSIAADLGAETPDGFVPIDDLGFGSTVIPADESLVKALQEALTATSANPAAGGLIVGGRVAGGRVAGGRVAGGLIAGDILTVGTITGSAATGAGLAARFPFAVAEAMEGYGVACAAEGAAVPFAEVRTVSNPVGPRDRASWRIREALAALTAAAATFPSLLPPA